jgi:hypothetical protein
MSHSQLEYLSDPNFAEKVQKILQQLDNESDHDEACSEDEPDNVETDDVVPTDSENESVENLSVPLHVESCNDDTNDVNILHVTERADEAAETSIKRTICYLCPYKKKKNDNNILYSL